MAVRELNLLAIARHYGRGLWDCKDLEDVVQKIVKLWTVLLITSSSGWLLAHEPPVFYKAAAFEGREMPFSTAVRVGDLLFLSGVIGTDPDSGKLAKGGIQGETRAALTEIKATVERHGSSMDKVVKCTVFLADIGEWAAMNEVYVTFFPNNKPARSALGSSGLAIDARVEIECIAAL